MNEETKKILEERLSVMPAILREAITDASLPTKLETITKKNNLLLDQAGVLETEVLLVLYGLEKHESFLSNLIKEGDLDKTRAQAVVKDVEEMIFTPVKEFLVSGSEASEAQLLENAPIDSAVVAVNPATNRQSILDSIENPEPSPKKDVSIATGQKIYSPAQIQTPTPVEMINKNMVNTSLSTPIINQSQRSTITTAPKITDIKKDPYKEVLE